MLRQHLELVPEDIQVQSDTLSELGLMQISRVYDLMYGGKGNGPSDVGRELFIPIRPVHLRDNRFRLIKKK
jgi:hypothetical protein